MKKNVILPCVASSLARATSAAAIGMCATLLGCSADSINMGEGAPTPVERARPPSSSRCAESPILEEDVVVRNQQELNALEGCEVIDGSLYVGAFERGQLRALHALRAVSHEIVIGETPDPYGESELPNRARWDRLVEEGWLSSLEGLEALESAASIYMLGFSGTDLAPLSSLRWLTAGYLGIDSALQLKSLDGLQSLTGLQSLRLNVVPQLESLDGLTLPRSMDYLELTRVDLSRLQPLDVITINSLQVTNTQLHDLTAFANLLVAVSIELQYNQQLESLAGVEGLGTLQRLQVNDSPYLLEIPDFELVQMAPKELSITANPRLTRLPAFPGLSLDPDGSPLTQSEDELIVQRPELIRLQELDALTTFSMPLGMTSAAIVQIQNNPNLRSIDFTGQSYIDYLSIQNNPLLETISTGALGKVNVLELVDNPGLSVTAFDGVRRLDLITSRITDVP